MSKNKSILINLVLISESFKALRFGEYAVADEENGEFVLNFENKDSLPTAATLLEVAKKNKVSISNPKGKKKDIAVELQAGLSKRKIPEQNEKPDTMIVAEIVAEGAAAGLSDEDMIVQIIDKGVKYKAAGRMFQQAMASGGFRISTKERKESILAILVEAEFAPENYTEVQEMIARLVIGDDSDSDNILEKVAETTESQALRFIKAHCKDIECDMPKAPKKAKGGFRGVVQAHVLENPTITEKQFRKFVIGKKKTDKTADRMWPAIEFAQKVAAATIALSDQDAATDEESESE